MKLFATILSLSLIVHSLFVSYDNKREKNESMQKIEGLDPSSNLLPSTSSHRNLLTTSLGINKTSMQPNEKDGHAHRRFFSFSFRVSFGDADFLGSFSIRNVFPSYSQIYPSVLKDVTNITSIVKKATFHPSMKN